MFKLNCEGCGYDIERLETLDVERWDGWSEAALNDLDAPTDTVNFTVMHKRCREEQDYYFEQGWNAAKYAAETA